MTTNLLVVDGKTTTPDNTRCWWGCKAAATLIHCLWKCKIVQTVFKTVWQSLIMLNVYLLCDPKIPLLSINIYPKTNKNCLHTKQYTNVYGNFIHNLWRLGINQMSMNWYWINELWHIYVKKYYSTILRNIYW